MKRREFLAGSALPLGFALAGCDKALTIEGGFVGANHQSGHLLRRSEGHGKATPWPAPSKTLRTRVLIAGGGVAGLAAARALRLQGMHDFTLLELEGSAGGNSRGATVNGIACPLGAHYLPLPDASTDGAENLLNLLEEFGLRQRVAGRWVYTERHLCHSPQERLFMNGQWQEGLLPVQGVDAPTLAEYQRFGQLVQEASKTARFAMPIAGKAALAAHRALDALTFEAWLNQHHLTSTPLRWYLDYCCRDDYGAGLNAVSAWAGIHYFASRHGFSSSDKTLSAEREAGVLTWAQGNGWLTERLAQPLGERLLVSRVVIRVAAGRHGVEIDAFNTVSGEVERWQADHCIMALPLFVAGRIVQTPPPALQEALARLRYAPWLVANIHINAALQDRPGAAPSWDNVIYSGDSANSANSDNRDMSLQGLGYVDAMHQSLNAVPGATVLTHYRAFGIDAAQRKNLYSQPWAYWRNTVLAELAIAHPDLPAKTTRIDIMRYGHAMSVPVPGIRSSAALQGLQSPLAAHTRLHFAHSDLSGYSVFEEAFAHGHLRGHMLARSH